ncbi:MAG: hypothetical protein E7300_03535 [Lachnospiraceae bacterium]|nr:hypothetical protein [Lachnospiraceae bacterium]
MNALGNDATVLYNHYVTSGQSEGRLPYEGASKGEAVDAPSGTTDEAVPQQPAAAKTYDVRDLKTMFKEQGWNWIDSYWLAYTQDLVNKAIVWPKSQIDGRTTIDWWKFSKYLDKNCVSMRFAGTEGFAGEEGAGAALYLSLSFRVPMVPDEFYDGKRKRADHNATKNLAGLSVYYPEKSKKVKNYTIKQYPLYIEYNDDGSFRGGPDWAKK